jgi:hypothetical protein
MATTFSLLQKRKCHTKTHLIAVRSKIQSHLRLTPLRRPDTDSWHWSDPAWRSLDLHHHYHWSWAHCPGVCVAAPHRPLGPHSPGALKYVWYSSRPWRSSTGFGVMLYCWELNPDLKRFCDVARPVLLDSPEAKKTHILLLLHGLNCYSVFCQDNFFAHRHRVAIATSVSWSLYKLDDWGIRVEFSVGEEIFVFFKAPGMIMGPTKHRFHWVPRSLPRL